MNNKEILHYVVVYLVLLFAWPILMNLAPNIYVTAILAFLVFVETDRLAHRFILGQG